MGRNVTLDVEMSRYFDGAWVDSLCVTGVILRMPNSLCLHALIVDERGAFLIKGVIYLFYILALVVCVEFGSYFIIICFDVLYMLTFILADLLYTLGLFSDGRCLQFER